MCKHILNAQVAIRSPCCQKWFDVSPAVRPGSSCRRCPCALPMAACAPLPCWPVLTPARALACLRPPVSQCAECHAEVSDHNLAKATEMAFACKKCKRTFRKDMTLFDEADEYCKPRPAKAAATPRLARH